MCVRECVPVCINASVCSCVCVSQCVCFCNGDGGVLGVKAEKSSSSSSSRIFQTPFTSSPPGAAQGPSDGKLPAVCIQRDSDTLILSQPSPVQSALPCPAQGLSLAALTSLSELWHPRQGPAHTQPVKFVRVHPKYTKHQDRETVRDCEKKHTVMHTD